MQLEGSCYCGAVQFRVKAYAPVPYMRCYCSVCRKTAGGGGYAINLGARADTLEIEGEENISMFHAVLDGVTSNGERRFCSKCGSALWVFDPSWPDLVHPFASAIDTPLPQAPESEHIMLDSKANWTCVEAGPHDGQREGYPPESLEDWHKRHGLLSET